jgi:hypothetical protein
VILFDTFISILGYKSTILVYWAVLDSNYKLIFVLTLCDNNILTTNSFLASERMVLWGAHQLSQSCCIGGGTHWFEVAGVFLFTDILGFVDLEEEVGGVADHTGCTVGGQKDRAGVAEPDHVAVFRCPETGATGAVQGGFQPADGDHGLGVEGGGTFNQVERPPGIDNKEQMLQSGRQLVLATLAGDLDGESKAAIGGDTL